MLNKISIAILFFVLLLSQQWVQAQSVLTLQDAVQQALKNNYNIILAKDNATIGDNNYTPGNAGMLPLVQLGAGVSYVNANTDQKYSSGTETKKDGAITKAYNYGAALSWTLFDGFKMFATYKKLDEIAQLDELAYKSQVEHSVASVITAYYGLVSQKQLLTFWDTAVSVSQKQVQIAERKFNIGEGSKVDFITAKIALNTDLSSRFTQQNQYRDSTLQFNRLIGRDITTKFDVADSIPMEEVKDFESLRNQALQHSPDIQIANKNVVISQYALKEVFSQRLPRLTLNGGYNFTNTNQQASLILLNQNAGLNAGLTLSWNIFNGFIVNTQMKNQHIVIDQMQTQLVSTQSYVDAQFNMAYNDYLNGVTLLKMSRENYELAHQNVTIALLSFSLGSIDALQMKDVEKTFEQTASDLETARYNLLQAKTSLDRLCGVLPGSQ